MSKKTTIGRVAVAALAACGLALSAALPASAASTSWNYSAPTCTETTITGVNMVASTSGGLVFRGFTSRTQDICPFGTLNSTSVTLTVNGISGSWSSVGTHSGTGQLTWGASRSSKHTYAGSSRTLAG